MDSGYWNGNQYFGPLFSAPLDIDWSGIENVGKTVSDALFGTNFIGNDTNLAIATQNLEFQKDYVKKMEDLQRESWNREDNAVQRRVADLKAAGLSPTLAAGSAAATSAPIQLKAPQNEFQYQNPFGGGVLDALAKVTSIKSGQLQNELLKKQIDTFGEPAWFKGFEAIIDKIFGDGSSGTTMSSFAKAFKDAFDLTSGRIRFTPKFGFTFGTPPSARAASTAIGRSAAAHGATFDESSMSLTFHSAEDARKWYLSIGGTSYEWYYGLAQYGTPVKFIEHIIQDGYITKDGDVYLDR